MQDTNNTAYPSKKTHKPKAGAVFTNENVQSSADKRDPDTLLLQKVVFKNARSAASKGCFDTPDQQKLGERPFRHANITNNGAASGGLKATITSTGSTESTIGIRPQRPHRRISKGFKNVSLESESLGEARAHHPGGIASDLTEDVSNMRIAADTAKIVNHELLEHRKVKWSDLQVSAKTIKAVRAHGFEFPSPVQYQSIPVIIGGNDVLVRAKNGTGKTLSFIIPILERIDPGRNTLQAIILVPIRELALQIARIFRTFCKDTEVRSTPLVGGSDLTDDIIRVSSGVHILIGTPGRILDVMGMTICKIGNNPILVFDEADKLLDPVFYESVHNLLCIVPKKRQICLYSATFPTSIRSFVEMKMNSPKLIKISSEYTLGNISQFFIKINKETKLPCLKSVLMSLDIHQCIIYCNYIHSVQMLAQKITEMGFSSYFIHSQMSQDERNRVYHNFSRNKCKILVSTDITTRGIDVHGINVVINFDLPLTSESYLHRMGRAGRFGTRGCCISLIHEGETQLVESFASFSGTSVLPACDETFRSFCKN